ncbi:unnamed protein product (macronuclear) [Paramecium tetraurelia]|uniref:Transmembrane protein 177 n=1 Tax=Paramecium tetraurelia TaxID=5888 RepID=A0DLV7_PARTE|nr:uncharacterized protein GSPATT00039657001 [Paramecium tetraurelia]CAK84024.1 unnamed protein product [Paramecium tetraurelia]|eukprot:XP_001451421.1 hypothetical protein (macronuclear) [Paramecium tetraurelia strain d4-2]
MSLSWLVSPQLHKTTNGYFINHDNIMLAGPQDKRRLIFYYIASQTPEKITNEDHSKFIKEKYIDVDMRSGIFSFGGIFLALATIREQQLITSRITSRPILNGIFVLGVGLVSAAFSYNLSQLLFEPLFVQRNKVISDLAEKYNFSVFDFALAKKEARLKQLRAELTSDSSNAAHF